ncbi:PHB depolymerase family esterase [Myxococcus sp. RHSTA-1-4]|uniref:extracellular catalytic domain type 1 short-chain-length polyhydroxyalkanoate depolymerase n=1 Tax=Myxococcus sp. RHSTA-1-4 TaxID=2874601 RepID=UPI001CC13A4A|nr:PHB depolymerase family esterase [Myxococcus sp. RHSTA-1-4]MBZ4417625.1 PHB depolymerase family esterase [Myxococcus sp. RHSTA-1-4]
MYTQHPRRSWLWSRFSGASLTALLLAGVTGCDPSEEGPELEPAPEVSEVESALTQVTGFGSNPGNLLMYRHVPSGMPANAPLVVVLHGCMQTAAAMEGSGWTAAANLYKFYALYPQQQSSNNGATCFNWFEPGDSTRGQGEALSIKQMVDSMKATYSIDPSRVYVAGFSAGGYMVPALLAAYPEVFSAGSINSGGPYGCAANSTAGFSCMSPGVDKTPAAWGDAVRSAWSSAGYSGPRPPVSIWHGTSDYTVKPMNMTEAMEQWTNVHGIDQTADTTETVGGFPHKVYRDSAGTALVETWEITNMGHAVGIDPQYSFPGSTTACGATGSYLSDVNLCAVYYQAQFFGLTGPVTPGDTTPPTVNVTAPANGATVSGTATVTASASDDVGVARVEFLVDGSVVSTDTAAPYEFAWNSTTVSNGSHTLGARAYDAAGNKATDSDTTVTVSNSGTPAPVTASFTSVTADDGYIKANADGSSAAVGTLTGLALGRGTDAKYNRSFLSFDTSSIPDTATITRAYLTVSYSSGSGDPWASPAGNTLVIDVKNGTFNAASTETADFSAAATASAVADIAKFTTGTKASADFSGAGLSAINLTGKTQLRLRFASNQTATAYVFIRDGASATLTVVYTP